MSTEAILSKVKKYYNEKLMTFGATPLGVDWNSSESQKIRFEQLLKVCDPTEKFSVNDYGCGYGALADYLTDGGYEFDYYGFDISSQMVTAAIEIHSKKSYCHFFSDKTYLKLADYTLASGIFNVKLQTADEEWQIYMLETLHILSEISVHGFAFNVLTKYSDPEFMRADLYYADPLQVFDYCKRNFSRFVALLHDYPLYEFTILVKK